jgi:hypothetical protein
MAAHYVDPEGRALHVPPAQPKLAKLATVAGP